MLKVSGPQVLNKDDPISKCFYNPNFACGTCAQIFPEESILGEDKGNNLRKHRGQLLKSLYLFMKEFLVLLKKIQLRYLQVPFLSEKSLKMVAGYAHVGPPSMFSEGGQSRLGE